MKTKFKIFILVFICFFAFQSCHDNNDFPVPANITVNDFIWKGLNQYYLWQADVPNLADNRFANQTQLNTFLSGYPKPENLFNALRVDKTIDRFSWIVDDYLVLEQAFQGTTTSDGIEFGLKYKVPNNPEIFGWVRYVVPNSDAATKNIKRGDIFYAVNGTQLTDTNYQTLLLNATGYTLNLADYNGGAITPNGKTVSLTKGVVNENPILVNTVINAGTHKIGYMMYNGFYSNYDADLNDAFGTLKSQGVTDFVLDLRYNPGGSVLTATRLASMITGGFTGQVFANQQWNAKVNAYFDANQPDALKNFFADKIGTTPINSLGLNKVYILTSHGTASASELTINGLKPYVTVVQIGELTVGKNVGSITIYDSPDFGKTNRNPAHRYAMQPIVLKIINAAGFGDYQDGLDPDFKLKEDLGNLDVLGSQTEPLLQLAIAKITGTGKMVPKPSKEFIDFKDSKAINGLQNQMYLEKIPNGILKIMN